MRKDVLDIPIDWLTYEELEHKLKTFVTTGKPHQITTVNPEFIVLSRENAKFKEVLQQSDLSIADGTGIVLAQTFFDAKLPTSRLARTCMYIGLGFRFLLFPHSFGYKRITGVDLSEMIMYLSAEHGWKVFLLGAQPGVAKEAAKLWKARYPELEIVGASASDPHPHTAKEVHDKKPDIILVAYGAPKQDLFIAEYKDTLKGSVMVGVGGTFDYLAGTLYRAPKLIRMFGLEWLVRLFAQPKRFKRIWRSTVTFSRLIIDAAPKTR